jgi:hypothetical protein
MGTEDVFDKYDEDVFDNDPRYAAALIWWLLKLAGGKVVFPVEEDFWDNNFPEDTRIVLRKEDGQLVMVAEQLSWTQ